MGRVELGGQGGECRLKRGKRERDRNTQRRRGCEGTAADASGNLLFGPISLVGTRGGGSYALAMLQPVLQWMSTKLDFLLYKPGLLAGGSIAEGNKGNCEQGAAGLKMVSGGRGEGASSGSESGQLKPRGRW